METTSLEGTGIAEIVTGAFANFAPQIGLVAAAGLGVAFMIWGVPKAVGLFKRLAK